MYSLSQIGFIGIISLAGALVSIAQPTARELAMDGVRKVDILNNHGRVSVSSIGIGELEKPRGELMPDHGAQVSEADIIVGKKGDRLSIEVRPALPSRRIDLVIKLPERLVLKIATTNGAITIDGNFADVQVVTDTGTIAANVPTDDLNYNFRWLEARPRVLSDITLNGIKELSGGRFQIKGKSVTPTDPAPENARSESSENKDSVARRTSLEFTTGRGIVLLNVPPSEVGSDLRERPLTHAAKAIVRSGDSLLMEAIRRAAPKYFGEYARSLPPIKFEPRLSQRAADVEKAASVKKALVRVTDLENRSVTGLRSEDFEAAESGSTREILSVEPSSAPFNLILLLDVSGSVENYVNFIRKTARNFVETVDERDRISLITFNEDVKVLSTFTTDRKKLSESLDSFDAGGGTAYYDALAFAVADTLRPIKGERSAIVILTDGDDNRSFLAFDSLTGSIQESGALIYPLYVPSGLIVAGTSTVSSDIDPLRKKYMALSAKSSGEGEKLARISGGVYYPISEISQIQAAYTDIVTQLRSGYEVTFRSSNSVDGVSPKLRIKAKRGNTFTAIQSVAVVEK